MAVWDLGVRLAHWVLALLIVVDLFNEAGANPWHRYLGYAAAALVVVRLAYGWRLGGHPDPRAMLALARRAPAYASDLRAGGRARFVGHNPLGALMAFAVWALVLSLALTGWMLQLDSFWGEDWLQDTHALAAYALGGLIVVHVGGVWFTSRAYGTNLAVSMITGRKRLPD
ncbi:MAG TPA: cytochrome b/b6 domain-containing protein [Burkholderiales bacterium]